MKIKKVSDLPISLFDLSTNDAALERTCNGLSSITTAGVRMALWNANGAKSLEFHRLLFSLLAAPVCVCGENMYKRFFKF